MKEKTEADTCPELSDMEKVIDLYGDVVYRFCCLYLGNASLAEDAGQETMIRAWRGRNSFRGESSLKTWLLKIAMNVCRNMVRTNSFLLWKNSIPLEEKENILSENVMYMEENAPLFHVLSSLPPKYREILILYYGEEWSCREIAEKLQISIHTVTTRLRRGRKLLEERLRKDGRVVSV